MIQNTIEDFAVFLDRDGTIIDNVPYLNDLSKINFIDKSIDAIKNLNLLGLKVFVVTNQSGVARGILTEEILNQIHLEMQNKLKSFGAKIDYFFYCPHLIDGTEKKYSIDCDCRKPKSGMLLEAKNKFNIDFKNSFMVGDDDKDIIAGKNVGTKTIKIEKKEVRKPNNLADFTTHNLYEASNIIISEMQKKYAV